MQESRLFFMNLCNFVYSHISPLLLKMRWNKMSFRGIAECFEHIFPIEKDTIYSLINTMISSTPLTNIEEKPIQIIAYDEQFVHTGGRKRIRIAILDITTGVPILETLKDSKTSEKIHEAFLQSGLDFAKPTIIVSDLDRSYPTIFKELFGENLHHQLCLFHLQQLICNEFKKNCSISDEYLKYQLLNIFFQHDEEISWLLPLVQEEKDVLISLSKKEYSAWLTIKKKEFRAFIRDIHGKDQKGNSNVRHFCDITDNLLDLLEKIESFPLNIQKRLKMMDENFIELTTFFESKLIPTTNNVVENYFFRTLSMGWKKRMRTDIGLMNHLKLQVMRISGMFRDVSIRVPELLYSIQAIIC